MSNSDFEDVPKIAFTLRTATAADADELMKLVCALAAFEKLEAPDAEAQARLVKDLFGPQPPIEAWLAFVEEKKEPVGYAMIVRTYSSFLALPTLHVEDVYVADGYRAQGIGTGFMTLCTKLALDRGCGRMEWTCLDWNEDAQVFYEEKMQATWMGEWYLYRFDREGMEKYLAQ